MIVAARLSSSTRDCPFSVADTVKVYHPSVALEMVAVMGSTLANLFSDITRAASFHSQKKSRTNRTAAI
jgi:hypothetical protein